MPLHETIIHTQFCCCRACKLERRIRRFETVSRRTYESGADPVLSLKLPGKPQEPQLVEVEPPPYVHDRFAKEAIEVPEEAAWPVEGDPA